MKNKSPIYIRVKIIVFFLVFLSLHSLLLWVCYLNLQNVVLAKEFSGDSTIQTETYELKVDGGFVQDYRSDFIRIRCKKLEPSITIQAKQAISLQIEIVNLHPQRSEIQYPDWKRLSNPTQVQLQISLKSQETCSIPIHFRYPSKDEVLKFLVVGDIEDGYYSLLEFRKRVVEENPLFIFSLGDLVNKGTWFRHKMMQDFLDTLPYPFIALPGDGDIDDFPGAKKRYLHERMSLFRRFYGESQFILNLPGVSLIALNTINTTLKDIVVFRELLKQVPLENTRLLLAHVPPQDPRPLREDQKKSIPAGEITQQYLQLMKEQKLWIGLYGHLHDPFDFFCDSHRVIVTGGLGARPFAKAHYDFLRVSIPSEKSSEIQVDVKRIAEGIGVKWLNKYSIYGWGWWYLITASWIWSLLHFLVFLGFLLKMRFFFRNTKKYSQDAHA